MDEYKRLTLQCRGSNGELEKDVGVVITIREDSKRISCPHYDYPRCKKTKEKCTFEDIAYSSF
jgi:hypothetical protein